MFYTKNHKHCAELEVGQMNTFVSLKIGKVVEECLHISALPHDMFHRFRIRIAKRADFALVWLKLCYRSVCGEDMVDDSKLQPQ